MQAGLAVWCEDEAGPFQVIPHPGSSWRPLEQPATQPHEYVRGGTLKILTLFQPATGQVRLRPAADGTNAVLHGWLKETLAAIVAALPVSAAPSAPAATRALWEAWQQDLAVRFTLPEQLPPLRVLLVWDNLAGHKTPEMVLWLCRHGIMPLYTPLGGSWLNMAESIQRLLKRRAAQAAGARRAAAAKPGGDRGLVRANSRELESTAHAVCLERPTAATPPSARRRWPPDRWLRGTHPSRPAALANAAGIPNIMPNDPLGRVAKGS